MALPYLTGVPMKLVSWGLVAALPTELLRHLEGIPLKD
jgi:hypothetical protein